ncbi:hypothetical protein AAY473_040113 [Plecturocebus cupreus]
MEGSDSLYTCLLIHICWKVDSEARMELLIHTKYLCSGGVTILIFMVLDAMAVTSFCILSAMPGYMVVPPDSTVLAYRSLQMSLSHFMMELKVVLWMPQDSMPKKEGWNSTSRHQNCLLPMGGDVCGGGRLLLQVQGDLAQHLLDVTHNLLLGRGGEAVVELGEDLHEIVGQVLASQVQTWDGMGEDVALVDGHHVGDPVSRVHDNASGVLLAHAHHHTLVPGVPSHGREHGWGGIVPSKASFAHARAIVNDECSDLFCCDWWRSGIAEWQEDILCGLVAVSTFNPYCTVRRGQKKQLTLHFRRNISDQVQWLMPELLSLVMCGTISLPGFLTHWVLPYVDRSCRRQQLDHNREVPMILRNFG